MTITATIRGAQRGIKLPPGFAVRGDGKWQPHSGTQPCHRERKKAKKREQVGSGTSVSGLFM